MTSRVVLDHHDREERGTVRVEISDEIRIISSIPLQTQCLYHSWTTTMTLPIDSKDLMEVLVKREINNSERQKVCNKRSNRDQGNPTKESKIFVETELMFYTK